VAAGVLLTVGASLAAQPVREWAVRQWTRLAGTAPAVDARPAAPAPAAAPPTDETSVSFVPAPGPLTLRLDRPPAGGRITVTAGVEPRMTVAVLATRDEAARGGVELLVLPGGVRARNAPGSTARYRVTLPASVRRLRVQLGPRAADTRILEVAPGETREEALVPER
jgi:hypothetical protein